MIRRRSLKVGPFDQLWGLLVILANIFPADEKLVTKKKIYIYISVCVCINIYVYI